MSPLRLSEIRKSLDEGWRPTIEEVRELLGAYEIERRAAIAAGLAMEAMREELERVKREREELRATALAGLAQITDGLEKLLSGNQP